MKVTVFCFHRQCEYWDDVGAWKTFFFHPENLNMRQWILKWQNLQVFSKFSPTKLVHCWGAKINRVYWWKFWGTSAVVHKLSEGFMHECIYVCHHKTINGNRLSLIIANNTIQIAALLTTSEWKTRTEFYSFTLNFKPLKGVSHFTG